MPLRDAWENDGCEQKIDRLFKPSSAIAIPNAVVILDQQVEEQANCDDEEIEPPQDREVHPIEGVEAVEECRLICFEELIAVKTGEDGFDV